MGKRLSEVREKYLEYFCAREHSVVASSSLVPQNDPTTLFTGSGMQPLLPYLLGEQHPEGKRIVNAQRCFRAEDIEEVGDNRHTTFFEMLGNWSLGSYFKDEQLRWLFGFLTQEVGLDPKRLYVTVFVGDSKNSIDRDRTSEAVWKEIFGSVGIDAQSKDMDTEERAAKIGMGNARIFFYGTKKNWWSRCGVPENMPTGEPGGPDSEIFFEFTDVEHDPKYGQHCHPNCDCGRFVEIGNSVFMEFVKKDDGLFGALPQKNVDFGGGLERIVAASHNNPDVFKIDVFVPLIVLLEKTTGKKYDESPETTRAFRVVLDHVRGATFMLGEGIEPSNTDQGYVARRLLRRAIRYLDSLQVNGSQNTDILPALSEEVIQSYKQTYPMLSEKKDDILLGIRAEEKKFRQTLKRGLKEFEKMTRDNRIPNGKDAFVLFSTYGFPFEMTLELSAEKGLRVDKDQYRQEFEKHRELSRTGSEKKFKGGLSDNSEQTVRYHTATHLLHTALKQVLGDHVLQKGSNITPERLRFDFSHNAKMTDEEKQKVEEIVSEQIKRALPVVCEEVSQEEARRRGAIGLFGEKYGERVKVYQIGDSVTGVFSLEFCGGPHVKNTKDLDGVLKIKKEESVGAGTRRIKAVLEKA